MSRKDVLIAIALGQASTLKATPVAPTKGEIEFWYQERRSAARELGWDNDYIRQRDIKNARPISGTG